MQCRICGKEYPSRYYFRTRTICSDCFNRMSTDEQQETLLPKEIYRLTTTAFTFDGYTITRSLGIVRGISVRSRSIFGTLGASVQTVIGGNITMFTELCETSRMEAFEMMIGHAEEIGANAIIGIRYDANDVMPGVTEVLCYGTAVQVHPG